MTAIEKAKALNLSSADFRRYARTAAQFGKMLASFTATKKDDACADLLSSVIEDDAQFAKLCEMLGLE